MCFANPWFHRNLRRKVLMITIRNKIRMELIASVEFFA
jgi:hypothetical protein